MPLETVVRPITDPPVWRSLSRILTRNILCALATVTDHGEAYVSTAYFAYTPALDLFFFSYPETHHALNLDRNPSMAIAVYDSNQAWGRADRGLQLFGQGRRAAGRGAREASTVYNRRFPGHTIWEAPTAAQGDSSFPKPFRFRPQSVKLFDERTFGPGIFIEAAVPTRGPARRLLVEHARR